MLKWESVIEYTFLSEFDLLQDTREDIRRKPWANSAVQEASDAYFWILCALEEIHQLNIEIRQVITKIKAEDTYLRQAVDQLKDQDPLLSYQVEKYCLEHAWFNVIHMRRFHALAWHPSFSGSMKPGEVADNQQREELGLSFLDAATEYYEGDADDSEDDEECEEVTETQRQQDIESIMAAFLS